MDRSLPESPLNKTATAQIFLGRDTLVREVYRSLLNTGRTYAAFTSEHRQLIERLAGRGEIFDPMSGYGLTTRFSAEAGVRSFGVEFNRPQYLWQILSFPRHVAIYLNAIERILARRNPWPKTSVPASISDDWFPSESRRLLAALLRIVADSLRPTQAASCSTETMALALLLPFSGRFSCSVPGDISTHTKPGGMCVFKGWARDFALYLKSVRQHLEMIAEISACDDHEVHLGDARNVALPRKRFGGMVTSPPYPNRQDFASTFNAENALLDWLAEQGLSDLESPSGHIIGSRFVSQRRQRSPRSPSASAFLKKVSLLKRDEKARYDDETYYLPYFSNYFADLEEAYKNIVPSLRRSFEGFVVVVDNTHRNVIVPVAATVLDIWRSMGFRADIACTNETFHVGTKNPRARGLRARHTEYTVRIWR